MNKKRIITLILFLIFMFSIVYADEGEKTMLLDYLKVIEQANNEIGYEYYEKSEVNKNVFDRYTALVYGKEHGDKKNGEYRYWGFTPMGEDFPSYIFPMDSWAGGFIDDRKWIKEPWINGLCNASYFDNKKDFEENIVAGLYFYYEDKFKNEFADEWYKYVHILQPPTQYAPGVGRMWHKDNAGKVWYLTIPLLSSEKASLLLEGKPKPKSEDIEIEFTVYHYEKDTENEVYKEDTITNPTVEEVYPKTGKGLDGNEWTCTLGIGPQVVDVINDDEYIFYYTKKDNPDDNTNKDKCKDSGSGGSGESNDGENDDTAKGSEKVKVSIITRDLQIKANCKISGRANIKKNNSNEIHPAGTPLFRGDNFKPIGTITNQDSERVLTEYKYIVKDKTDGNGRLTKDYRIINNTTGEFIISGNNTQTVAKFNRIINNSDPYGNVYILTIEARQRLIVPTPPEKPGSKLL